MGGADEKSGVGKKQAVFKGGEERAEKKEEHFVDWDVKKTKRKKKLQGKKNNKGSEKKGVGKPGKLAKKILKKQPERTRESSRRTHGGRGKEIQDGRKPIVGIVQGKDQVGCGPRILEWNEG